MVSTVDDMLRWTAHLRTRDRFGAPASWAALTERPRYDDGAEEIPAGEDEALPGDPQPIDWKGFAASPEAAALPPLTTAAASESGDDAFVARRLALAFRARAPPLA